MESQGTRSGESGRDNVVHLPARDWLGSREDLVPLGPAKQVDLPPAADDFWGEDSACLQAPLQPPAAPEIATDDNPPARRDGRAQLARSAWRRWLAAGAVVAVVGVLALVVSGLGGNHAPARAVTTKTQLAASTGSAHRQSRAVARRPSHRRKRTVVHKSVRHTISHRHVAAATSAPSTASTTPAASSTDSGASRGSTNVSARVTEPTASDTSSSTGHPTGPGAPFAPGYIP
jgi:hypothetical protein